MFALKMGVCIFNLMLQFLWLVVFRRMITGQNFSNFGIFEGKASEGDDQACKWQLQFVSARQFAP